MGVKRSDFQACAIDHSGISPLQNQLIGNPDEVTEKILRHSEALGGISRLTFQMNAASLPHAKLMRAIEAIGTRIAPALKENWSRSLDNTCASVVCRVTETIV